MKMKVDAMGLLLNAALSLKNRDDATAFALLELSNNLRLLMRGEAPLTEWNETYVGAAAAPVDIDAVLPV